MGRIEIEEALVTILQNAKLESSSFGRTTYGPQFEGFCKTHMYTLNELEAIYHAEDDNADILREYACVFADFAAKEIASLKKQKRKIAHVDYNLAMVTFVFPFIDKANPEFKDLFADACVDAWNTTFPDNNIGKASQEVIQGGFKTKLCYITTAVCDSLEKTDDCYELTTLRNYRDNYLLSNTEDGAELVQKYYDIAPTIVKRLGREEDAPLIYKQIWETYLEPCIRLIEQEHMEETKHLYTTMVEDLSTKYLYQ